VTRICLDASTVIAWAKQEKGWEAIDRLLRRPGVQFLLPGTALTEVVDVLQRGGNTLSAPDIAASVLGQGIVVELLCEADHVHAAELLAISREHPDPPSRPHGPPATLSLSDASILAVAARLDVKALTGDEHWANLSAQGLVDVEAVLFPRW